MDYVYSFGKTKDNAEINVISKERLDNARLIISHLRKTKSNCGNCDKTDGLCYTSDPPQVKCTITGEFHYYDDECNVEFVPVKYGHWIEDDDGDGRHCSICGEDYCYLISNCELYNYCPNCGGKMDEETKHE